MEHAQHLVGGAPAGLVSGPRMLKMVRTPIRGGPARRSSSPLWWLGANMKPMPVSARQVGDLLGVEADVGAQRFHHVGARVDDTAAPPCLAILGAGGRGDEHGGGGDVEGVRGVAAGADDVDQVARRPP